MRTFIKQNTDYIYNRYMSFGINRIVIRYSVGERRKNAAEILLL